jgi:hypothetical protein
VKVQLAEALASDSPEDTVDDAMAVSALATDVDADTMTDKLGVVSLTAVNPLLVTAAVVASTLYVELEERTVYVTPQALLPVAAPAR